MDAEQQTTQTEATTKEQKPATPPAGVSNTEQPSQEQTVPYTRFKEVNDRLKALEDEAATKATEQQAEDEKKLAAQAEWQKLAESRKAKVEELKPKADLADKLSAMVLEQYDAEIKEWPEQVKAMAPSAEADVLVKLDWMKRAKPLALELMADKTPTPGNGRRPTPSAPAGTGAREEKARDEQRQWTRSNF